MNLSREGSSVGYNEVIVVLLSSSRGVVIRPLQT
jgi:hypothetical protein